MKRIITFCILILTYINIFSIDINEYELILLNSIKTGNQEGELGDTTPFKQMGGVPTNPLAISENNLIYVCDFMNQRINIYDLNLKFVKEIKDNGKSYLYESFQIRVNYNGDIIGLTSNGLIKIDNTGQEIYKIKINELSDEVKYNHEYFIIDKNILYYDQDKYYIINDMGEKLNNQKSGEIILNLQAKQAENLKNTILSNEGFLQVQSYLSTINVISYNNYILTGNFKKMKEYNQFIYNLNNNKIKQNDKSVILSLLTEYDRNINIIGYDKAGNSYWKANTKKIYDSKPVILICSKYGEIIDCFYNIKRLPNIAISPNGDVYFMDRIPRDSKFFFYKVERRW